MNAFDPNAKSIPEFMDTSLTKDFFVGKSDSLPMPNSLRSDNLTYAPYAFQGAQQWTGYTVGPDYRYVQTQQECQTMKLQLQLEYKLKHKILKEEELKQVLRLQGNAYFSIMESGRPVQLTHFVFEKIERITYDPYYGRKAQICVKVSVQENEGLLDLEDFWNDKKWLTFLEQVSRTKIKMYGSVKRIALLLRSIANEKMRDVFVPYFGGWAKIEDCDYHYYTFRGFRTSARGWEPEPYEKSHVTLPANAKAATERFLNRFTPILDGKLRSFCILWQHLSFLQTLLLEQGICLTKVPVVQAENPVVQSYLCSVLTVSTDGMLNMNRPTEDFVWGLASCKDQPCVILPPKFGKNAMDNERILDEAMSGSTITLKKEITCPLGTLPILLVNGGGQAFACGIPLSARAEAFDLPRCAEVATEPACPADYWSGFLAFTHLHMDELNHLLKQQMEKALIRSAECEYTMEYAAVLGAMWGVAEFIRLFLRELALNDSEILDDGWLDYVVALLEESEAQCEAPDGLAEGFLAFARKAIRQKGLPCYRIGQMLSTIPRGAVYFNEDLVCLDRVAFEKICQAAGCQSAAVKRELSECGYFSGKTVNRQAYESRISICCEPGGVRIIRVYKFRRDLFETLGEPALFQEV